MGQDPRVRDRGSGTESQDRESGPESQDPQSQDPRVRTRPGSAEEEDEETSTGRTWTRRRSTRGKVEGGVDVEDAGAAAAAAAGLSAVDFAPARASLREKPEP